MLRLLNRKAAHYSETQHVQIVQLEIDEKEINKNVKVDEYILGDIKEILIALTIGLDRQNHPDWLA